MAIAPTFRRTPLKSMLDFAADREREASSIGNVIDQITKPILGGMGVQTDNMVPQPAVMRGPAPQAQPLGAFTGPPMAPTPVDFNPRSTELLGAADPRLREILTETERRAREQGIEIQVSETLRDPERQAALVEQGKSQTMDSRHLTGNAVDIFIQNPDGSVNWDFEAYRPVADIAKQVAAEKGYDDLVWGGDWQTLKDGVHFQLGGATTSGSGGATTLMGGAGGDTLGGGMNVEDILARLYPEMTPEEERRTRRQDIMAGAGDVLMALSQGRSADISAIRAQQEARKRQAVLDMRERERARAAASLVYSQTGDRDLAASIATGAISYGDVVSERERRRVEAEADKARVKQEQANGRLAGMVESMAPDLGIPTDLLPQIVEGIKAGDDPNTYFTLTEQAKLAEAARKADEEAADAAEARAAALETFTTSQDPVEQRAGRLMTLDPKLSLDDALTRASELLKTNTQEGYTLAPGQVRFGPNNEQVAAVPAGAAAATEVADIAKANMMFEGGALNPLTGQPFSSAAEALAAIQFYKAPPAATGGVSLQYSPEGGFTFTQGAAPAAGGAAAGGGVVEVAKPEAGTATVVQDGQLTAVPIAGATAPAQAATDLEAAQQALAERIAAAPSALEKARLENEKLRLDIQAAQATQGVDEATKAAQLANLEAEAAKKQAEVAALEKAEAQQSSAAYSNAVREFSVMEEAVNKIIPNAQDFWVTGLGAVAGRVGAALGLPTERSSFLEAAKQLGSQAMLTALAEAKAAGVTLTPVSNLDVSALGASQSRLSMPENLTGEDILKETVFQYNYAKDALYGPRDLTRYDDFGQPYQLGENTLGVTEDTFVRHWANIPPEVAEAWRTGAIAALPTDDPLYAEAASTINEMVTNWETFQGDLDRAKVGMPEDSGEPVDMADLPPAPEGFPEDEWADTWANMSEAAREAYRKKMEGAQ